MHKKIANMYVVSSGYTYIDFLKQEKNTVQLQQKKLYFNYFTIFNIKQQQNH